MPTLIRVLKHIEMTTCPRCGARYLWSPFAEDDGCVACKRRAARVRRITALAQDPYIVRRLRQALEPVKK